VLWRVEFKSWCVSSLFGFVCTCVSVCVCKHLYVFIYKCMHVCAHMCINHKSSHDHHQDGTSVGPCIVYVCVHDERSQVCMDDDTHCVAAKVCAWQGERVYVCMYCVCMCA
jgi:hypothetical protein